MKIKIILFFLLYSISYISLGAEQSESTAAKKQTTNTETKKEQSKKVPTKWVNLKKELKNRRSALTSPIVQRRLQRIHRTMSKKDSEDKVLELIEKLEKIVEKRLFDLARLYQLKAQVYLSKDDFKKASLYYKKAISLKRLSYNEHLSVLYDLATLNLFQNKIKKASQLTDQIFYLADTIPSSAYILKASLLVEQKKKKEALELVMKAIQSTTNPNENWLAFGAALNIDMEQYIPAARLLIKLTSSYPKKKKYWKQLSAIYLNINKDDRALATLDLAYKLDFLEKEQEILHLASLLMYQGLSFKAANLIEKSMKLKKVKATQKNHEILGDCWLRAEETKKALAAYHLAAPAAEDGKLFFKMSRIYMSNQNWSAVADNLQKALSKGGIKHLENIYISMGIAYVNLKKYAEAINSFEQVIATEAKGQHIKIARDWINYTKQLANSTASLHNE